ncbi:hypothetical protein AB0R12_35765, partial [Streptomyces niveus]|uniref:hypothetical protein n=1 Tax=Streptomyces niveus TaxID=193462 RepID=UPI00343C5193
MTFDRLVCANCAGPVSEGRCHVCRANRQRLEQEGPFGGLSPVALLTLLVVYRILLFTFASLLGGFAQEPRQLLAARALQGVGGA